MKVTTVGGATWRVRRRWWPWRRAVRGGRTVMQVLDTMNGLFGVDSLVGLPVWLGLLVLVLWVLLLVPATVLLAAMALEALAALVVSPFVLAARAWGGAPWPVEVVARDGAVVHDERVVGRADSLRRVRELAEHYRQVEPADGPGPDQD